MRIGLFSDTYYPRQNGVAISVYMLAKNLISMGYDVYVFTTTDPDAPEDEQNVTRIPSVAFKTQRLGTYIGPMLHRAVKHLDLDIVHTHTEYTLGRFGKKLAKRLKIPYIHTMHTIYEYYTNYIVKSERLEPPAKYVVRRLTATVCNSADIVVTPTEKNKDLLVEYGVNRPIRIIPSGIQLEKFSDDNCDFEKVNAIRTQLGISEDDKVLINIGRVAHEKNLDELISGLADYLHEHNRIKLVIVGDGLAKEKLEHLTDELKLNDKVIFAGARPWDDIYLYYRLGDAFVGASLSETQGLTYIEAMASGLPVIAKEDRCLDGVLLEGENGFFFNDNEKLITAVDRLLSDDAEREHFSKHAQVTANKFSAYTYAREMSAVYKEMI